MRKIIYPSIIALIFLGCGIQEFFTAPTPTPIPHSSSKRVVDVSLPLHEIWRRSGIMKMPIFSGDKLILASWERGGNRILVLDAQTGNLIWESDEIFNLASIQTDGDRIYAGAIRYVEAYDITSGKVWWQGAEQPKFKRGGLAVYPNGENLEVYDSVEGKLYVLNARTGETLDFVEWPHIIVRKDGNYYSRNCGYQYCYFNLSNPSESRLWQNQFDGFPRIWPIFIDGLVYVGADTGIYAIEIETGNIHWQSRNDYVTGIGIGDKLIYAVVADASIVGLNLETGQIVGKVEVEPNRTFQDDVELGHTTHYSIAVSEKYVAVYYGNSGELIVFEIEQEKLGGE